MTAPEFSRPEPLDRIGADARAVSIAADAAERAALARRFGLIAIARLEAHFTLDRDETGVVAAGRVTAAVTQACSATGEPLDATVDEPVALRFVERLDAADELELTEDALDTLPIEGGAIDLGEAAAETMALALDPFPRSADADTALAVAGVADTAATGPFAALAALKHPPAGDD